ncbi:hypothetical protein GGR50DRAFT_468922 [Xylaria sp. CBS 124048]|nr:hypothetical protein GGR50DRAFT_468922 [Xylaria sp. CBS 124048]
MAAAAVTGFADPSGTWDGPEWSAATLPFTTHTPQWTELDVNERLTIISRLWLLQRTLELNQVAQHRRATTRRPLAIPNPTPKRSRLSSPLRDRKLLATGNVNGPTRSGECAQRRLPSLPNGEPCSLPPSDSPQPRDRSEDALFRTSIPEACCDLSSADGIIQHAGKKKKNKNQSSNYNAPDKKDAGGAGDGGSGNGGNQNGDTGNAEGGSAGSGNGDDKKNGSSGLNPDDDGLGTFAAVGKKKKKGANEAGKTLDLLGSDPKLDTFDEIKLDDTGPSPGLKSGGGKATISLNPFSSWGTSWNTGITTDAASTQASDKLEDKTEDKKEEHNFDAWGSDQPKQKEKTKIGFSLGGFAEAEKGKTHESSEEKGRNEFDFGFASAEKTEKKKKKSSFWDAEPKAKPDTFSEAQDAGSAAVDNPWGSPWADAQTTKKKTKKGAATFLDPAPDSYKPEPVASTPDDDFWAVLDTKNSRKGKKAEKVAEPDTSAAEPTSGVLRKEDTQKSPQLSITKEKEKEDKEKEKDKGKDKDKDKDKKKKKDKVVDPEPDSTKAPAKPVKDPKPDAMPESEPRPAPVVTPAVEPVAAPSAPPAAAPVITPAPPPVKESGGSAWNFWGATRKVIRTAVEQIPAEPAPAAENNEEGWIWGKKDNKKSLVEAPKEESESEGWSWGFRKEKKKSPPPAPTPPPINTDATASDKNANASSGPQIETEPDPVSTMLAADIVAEENELALLQAKKLKRGLSSKHQRRLDELIKNANDRAEQAATKKAEEKMKQEAEANSAAEALQVQESTNDAAKALEAEIAAEEDELEMLKIKINKASKGNKKLNWGDQQRFDELTQRANTRANLAATEANVSGYTADKQATFETKQQAIPEAEVSTTDGAEERASESKKQAVLETDIPGEEEELEKLQIKAAKLKKNRRLSAEDQLRLDELSRRAEARAAAATATAATTIAMEANAEADRKDSRTALESEEPVTREKITRADREAEEQAAHEADEADKAELAALQKKRKLLKADKRRIDKLTERINARAVSADADRKNAKTEIDEQAARKAEEQLALEAEKQAKAEAEVAREAEEADDAEFEALTVRLERKRKLPIKDQERLDILTQKIRSRVATTTPGRDDTPIQIEESVTPETRDQATLEAEERAALEVATQAARDAEAMETEWREATRRAEEDADDAELENLTTKLKKNKRLTMQDQKRFDILTDKVNARTAIRDSAEDNVQASIQSQETPKTMEQGAAEVDEQAYLMTAEQVEREAEKVAAARKADEAADDMELEELTTKLKKKKRLSSKDQARLERLTKKVNDRVAIKLTDNGNTQTGQEIEEFSAHEAEISHAREVEQAVPEAEERSQAEADKEAARKVEEADDEELDALRTKLRKKKKLSSRDQDRYDKLTEKFNARVAVATLGR